MIQRRKPILRKTPLKRVSLKWVDANGQLRPIRYMPKMSKKRQRESRVYSAKRKQFLEDHRYCQVEVVCMASTATDVHHVEGRLGGNYLDEKTWLSTCRRCHDWIHSHPKEARASGVLK